MVEPSEYFFKYMCLQAVFLAACFYVCLNCVVGKYGGASGKTRCFLADVSGKDVLHAYDITIFYGNGSEFEPADGETIAVSFQSDDIKKAVAKDNDSLTVGHINDSAIITDGNHIRLDTDPDGSYLYSGKLYLRHGMTLYAHWRAVNTADYKVVIWKQKVTDDKNATDANKHYDYYDYTLMEGAASGSVILDLASYQAKGFENLANSGNSDFECFHYNRTEVVVDGVAYDGSTQREQGVVAPNGSTVVNVYYDRDLMTIRFDYGNNYTSDPNGDYIRVSSNYYSISDYRSIIESNGQISYLSSSNGGAPYNGTIYYKSGNSYYQLTGDPDPDTTYYYKSGSRYYSLRWNDYTGTRYKKNDVIFTGLYEQTFAQNGYQWSDVSDVKWLDGSTTQTLLDGFVDKRNPYVLTANGASGTSIIYHYKQGPDGKYSIDDRVIAYGSGGTSFKFTNKFRGFTVSSYKTGSNGFDQNGGTSISVDQSASVSYPLHVYHSRNSFKLTFANYRTESNSGGQPNDWVFNNVPYEKPLSEIIAENPSLMTPPARDNYDFEGWYLDAGCTKEADFSEEFMPAANMIVYAKWDLKHYMVEIDPDGAGPNATLWFEDISELDYSQMSGTNGINGISIIKNTANTFSVNESFTNTNYKFIGWYETNTAAPGDVTLDGRTGQAADGSYGAAKVEDIPVPNTSPKYYFALYVPKADGNLVISHDEKDSSIGYPKYMSVAAQYGTNTAVTDDETTNITSIADRTDKVHTSVSIPVSETWSINIGNAFDENNRPTAPLIIENSDGSRVQFYRWKITETEKGSSGEAKLVGYCYYNEFTFMVWDDYYLTPEYVEMTGDEYQRYYPDDEQTAYANITDATEIQMYIAHYQRPGTIGEVMTQ